MIFLNLAINKQHQRDSEHSQLIFSMEALEDTKKVIKALEGKIKQMGEAIKQQQQEMEKTRKKETEAETQEATVESRKRDRDGEYIQLSNNDGWNGGR